jgi:phospholipid/cholesterol/gamma-HCH transport system substrate-binding protein
VKVAGRLVGGVSEISLSPDGQADVVLEITDRRILPLRSGTRATIRAVGQAGVASRFVDLEPGPTSAVALDEAGILPATQTRGIVDLDQIFTDLDARTRTDLRRLIAHSSEIFAGSGSRAFNKMLVGLAPAMAATSGVAQDLAHDEQALQELVVAGARAAEAVGSRRTDLEEAVAHSARAFSALAAERRSVAQILKRAPAVLDQAGRTLRRTGETATSLRPMLRSVPPAAKPARDVLRRLTPTLGAAVPVMRQLRSLLPDVRRSLTGFGPLARPAISGLRALRDALTGAQPIMRGLRIYGADFVLGVTNGLAGIITSNYNRTGHYARLNFVENPQTLLAGVPSSILSPQALVPGVLQTRTGVTAMCPGGNQPPAPDGSNPYIPDPSLCDPTHAIPASVNEP